MSLTLPLANHASLHKNRDLLTSPHLTTPLPSAVQLIAYWQFIGDKPLLARLHGNGKSAFHLPQDTMR